MIKALGMLAFAMVLGCGYSTGSLMPEGVRDIAVRMATNDTFYRGDEIALTREVTRQLMRRTDVIIRDQAHAEAVLSTRIVRIGRAPLVVDRNEVTLEEGVIAEVAVVLSDRITGRAITEFTLTRRAEGIRDRGEDLEATRLKLMREIAEDIVLELQKATFVRAAAPRSD